MVAYYILMWVIPGSNPAVVSYDFCFPEASYCTIMLPVTVDQQCTVEQNLRSPMTLTCGALNERENFEIHARVKYNIFPAVNQYMMRNIVIQITKHYFLNYQINNNIQTFFSFNV